MAKIVIDCRMWGESGIGRYIRNLVFNLQVLDRKNEYFLILLEKDFNSETDEVLKRLPRPLYRTVQGPRNDDEERGNNFHKVLADFRWYGVGEQIKLPGLLNKLKPDLVHFPHFNVPIFYSGKFVVTIHDLIHQHYKMDKATLHDPLTYKIKHLGYKKVFRKAVKDSVKILTPSEYVKKQLIDEWNVWDGKIVVTPEAVDDNLLSTDNKMVKKETAYVMKKFGIRVPYIFNVGNAHPHKNVEGLMKAFLKLKDSGVADAPKNDNSGLQLVLSGTDNYFWKKIKSSAISHQSSDIVFTGYVTDEKLAALYKNATCFVMPSFEEGFGIPILEAMAFGCPVVSSNAGSLQEVGGDAALYFNPHDLEDMGNKIDRVLKSEKLRQELIKKGKERVKKFSWKNLAEETLEVYQKCV